MKRSREVVVKKPVVRSMYGRLIVSEGIHGYRMQASVADFNPYNVLAK